MTASADVVAVRGTDGRLAIVRNTTNPFAVRDWLTGDGDARQPDDQSLGTGSICDDAGCTLRLATGSIVSVPRTAHALAEDCIMSDLVITNREAPPNCRAVAIDRRTLQASGAMTFKQTDQGWTIKRVIAPGSERPWARSRGQGSGASNSASSGETNQRVEQVEPAD